MKHNKKNIISESELATAILKLRTEEEIISFLADLLTRQEFDQLLKRWSIARKLHTGETYQDIERKTGASSATISKVSEQLNYGSDILKLVFERLDKLR